MRELTLQAAWQVPVVSKDLNGHQAAEGMRKQLKCRVSTEISYIVLRVLLVLMLDYSFSSNTFPTCLRTSQFHPIPFSHYPTTTFHLWRRVPWRFSLMVKLLVCGTHSRTVTIEMLGEMSQISKDPSFLWEMSDSGFKFQNHPRSCMYWLGGLRGSRERADKACGEQWDFVWLVNWMP